MADGADAARRHFAARGKTVLTFLGYSGSGYEDEAVVIAHAVLILNEADPRTTLVNIGGTPESPAVRQYVLKPGTRRISSPATTGLIFGSDFTISSRTFASRKSSHGEATTSCAPAVAGRASECRRIGCSPARWETSAIST